MPTRNLNTLVDVLTDVSNRSDYDPHEPEDEVVCSAWVQITPQRAQEQIDGQQVVDVVRYLVYMRYDPRITPGMRLQAATGTWDIHTVMDVDMRHEELELTATPCQTISA